MASEAAEHLRRSGELAWDERWIFPDPNGDGLATISDASRLFAWFFCAPGDWLISFYSWHPQVGELKRSRWRP